jgi:gramicidin S synthase 2
MQKRMWLEANGIHDFVAAYRLSPMVSIEKLRDALNAYACLNSSFNVAIEDDNGEPVQVYNPETPRYEIETMTEEEVKELQKTFVGPFEYGEPLIRIRLIRTGLHKYLFFQIAHLITDGAGVRLFVQDISTLYNGVGIRPAYYFAYAYDCAIPVPDDMMKDASE